MNSRERLCARCGQPYVEEQNFCSKCGAYLGMQAQERYFQYKYETRTENDPKETTEEPIVQPTNKNYKTRKGVSLGFAIGDMVVAFLIWIVAIIFYEVSNLLYFDKVFYEVDSVEYILSGISDIYYLLSCLGYILAIVFAVGSVASWVMFVVYLKKIKTAEYIPVFDEQEMQFEEQDSQSEENIEYSVEYNIEGPTISPVEEVIEEQDSKAEEVSEAEDQQKI